MSYFNVPDTASSLPSQVLEQFTFDDGSTSVPLNHNINIHNGSGISVTALPDVSGGPNFTISATDNSFEWEEEGSDFGATVQVGYFCTGALTVFLPPTLGLSIGATVIIYVDTASTITIQTNTGQMIAIADDVSIVGGTASSNAAGSTLTLTFRPSDTTWHAISSLGTWTVQTS